MRSCTATMKHSARYGCFSLVRNSDLTIKASEKSQGEVICSVCARKIMCDRYPDDQRYRNLLLQGSAPVQPEPVEPVSPCVPCAGVYPPRRAAQTRVWRGRREMHSATRHFHVLTC